jgi:hypothetical protein
MRGRGKSVGSRGKRADERKGGESMEQGQTGRYDDGRRE